ncbi:MAG TPA: galactose-1-phosphate uridylyltransferase [Methanoregulaceae archaeon]|nr:galactose-1-phosphate uridylyltransferase [Methanoregulaceae archaeon]
MAMFAVREIGIGQAVLQYRKEDLTGFQSRISPGRTVRGIDGPFSFSSDPAGCPFCPGAVENNTPVFPDGNRVVVGESITFPNLFPFSRHHIVTVITQNHQVDAFGKQQLLDAFEAQYLKLQAFGGYPSINWNYLPSAGASIAHPHLQGIADTTPTYLMDRYLSGSRQYLDRYGRVYWDDWKEHENETPRFLTGDEISWYAHAVPLGEREVRGILPVSTLEGAAPYFEPLVGGILDVIGLYRDLGTHAFNMSLFFDRQGNDNGFRAFCSMISRINPNGLSLADSSFMERLHLEPIILTLPEELGNYYRNMKSG